MGPPNFHTFKLPHFHTSTLPNFHTPNLPDYKTSTLPNFHTSRHATKLPPCIQHSGYIIMQLDVIIMSKFLNCTFLSDEAVCALLPEVKAEIESYMNFQVTFVNKSPWATKPSFTPFWSFPEWKSHEESFGKAAIFISPRRKSLHSKNSQNSSKCKENSENWANLEKTYKTLHANYNWMQYWCPTP